MLSVRKSLRQAQTNSVRAFRTALSSERTSVRQLMQTQLIHNRYTELGAIDGVMGFPVSEVQFSGASGVRHYRGGEIEILGDIVKALPHHEVTIRFLGFKCVREADHDQLSPHDEPYFIISVDTGSGSPTVRKFGEYTGVDSGTEIAVAELLISHATPNPMAVRVAVFENDYGDPDETAKKIQEEVVKLSQQAQALASAAGAGAADGPGVGPAAAAGTVGAIAAGPLGALVAAGIVTALDLGDDFVGQSAMLLFERAENVGTPPPIDKFQNMTYNRMIKVNGGAEGEYDLFFDVLVQYIGPFDTVGG
jgi:hypothetical protein